MRSWSRNPRADEALDVTARQAARDARRSIEGDVICVDERRLVLRSPDGHFWQVTVDNTGALGTVDLGTEPLA